jgi:SAM-dependent methyltransferase
MSLGEHEVMYHVEDHHWWYLGMEQITCSLLNHTLERIRDLNILDAGCGTGAVMKYLAPYGRVAGFDFAREALNYCRQRGHRRLARASVCALPFAADTFDLIVSFDVICQLGVEDRPALSEFARVLKPKGYILLRLPAYQWLYGKHDIAVRVGHRYTRPEIKRKLASSGLRPIRLSYANTFLFPIAVLKRLGERLIAPERPSSELTVNLGALNGVLRAILSAESPLIRTVGLPFGLTVVALAVKDVVGNG